MYPLMTLYGYLERTAQSKKSPRIWIIHKEITSTLCINPYTIYPVMTLYGNRPIRSTLTPDHSYDTVAAARCRTFMTQRTDYVHCPYSVHVSLVAAGVPGGVHKVYVYNERCRALDGLEGHEAKVITKRGYVCSGLVGGRVYRVMGIYCLKTMYSRKTRKVSSVFSVVRYIV